MQVNDPNMLFREANTKFQQGQLAEAVALTRKILLINPGDADAGFLLGLIAE